MKDLDNWAAAGLDQHYGARHYPWNEPDTYCVECPSCKADIEYDIAHECEECHVEITWNYTKFGLMPMIVESDV